MSDTWPSREMLDVAQDVLALTAVAIDGDAEALAVVLANCRQGALVGVASLAGQLLVAVHGSEPAARAWLAGRQRALARLDAERGAQ